MIQLLHRTVHPIEPKAELTIDRVASQQHDELEPTTHSAQHAAAAHLEIEGLAQAPDPGPIWALRHRAAHLWRSPHGIWYVRLVVPESIRREHPNLPAELRRTTKTCVKRVAEDFARKICIDFFVRYSKRENPMFGLDEKKNAFTVSYIDGALRAECTPDATPHTLFLMKQSFITMLQTLGRGERLHSTTPVPPPLALAEVPITPPAANPPAPIAETRHAPATTPSPNASGHGVWLSDAIEDWRSNSGVKFSAETWEFAYMATFRVFRELVGDVRRVAPASPGPQGAGQLDILVGSLTRQHVLRFHEQLQLLPPRQGKRCDGIEAPLRIAEARKTRQARPSRGSIKKKLRHIAPFVVWCELKGYVTAEVLKEFKLAQKAASGSGGVGAKKAIVRKPGYIAFAHTELKQIFEQPSYRTGAAKDDWRYWVPLLCLFNGLRVAEASQSHTGDLCIVDGVHCLRTATVEDEDESEMGDDVIVADQTMTEDEYRRRLKNNASRRTVPIHPRLIELGFLDFVASLTTPDGETRHLFPCLPWHPKSLWGRKPSDFMGGLIRKAGVYVFRKKIPHSLRSNFNQAVEKTGLKDALIQRLMGHSTGTMKDECYGEAEYGAAIPAALVHTHLQQTDFDINLPTWRELVSWRSSPGTKH